MGYCSASDVAAMCKNLVNTGSNFTASTVPTVGDVNNWISTGCSVINTMLGGKGYGPVPTTSGAYDMMTQINANYAAWYAERSRINARVTSDERTRADMFKRDFDTLMEDLLGMDLTLLGVPRLSQAGKVYAGGISRTDKQVDESNTDRVPGRFRRGDFANPDAPKEADKTSA